MIKVMTTITYDKPSDKYIVVGHLTDTDGKASPWEVNEEIIMRSHDISRRSWDSLQQAVADIKEHSAFTVKVKFTRPTDYVSSSFF
jgi:hypothetical protein